MKNTDEQTAERTPAKFIESRTIGTRTVVAPGETARPQTFMDKVLIDNRTGAIVNKQGNPTGENISDRKFSQRSSQRGESASERAGKGAGYSGGIAENKRDAAEESTTEIPAVPVTNSAGNLLQNKTAKRMEFALRDLLASPFRDFVLNPIKQATIDPLEESIRNTGYWHLSHPITGRIVPSGQLEIIFGHHRAKALTNIHGEGYKVSVVVIEASDEEVNRMFAREHHVSYNHSLLDTIERVRSAVGLLGRGGISPEKMPLDSSTPKQTLRYAPSCIVGLPTQEDARSSYPYTANSLAKYLGLARKDGRAQTQVAAALAVLECVEKGAWGSDTIRSFENDGYVSAERVLRAATQSLEREVTRRARAAAIADKQRLEGLSIQERVNAEGAERKRLKEDAKRLLKQRMEATLKEDMEKAARIREKEWENKRKQEEGETKRRIAEKQWEESQQMIRDSEKALKEAGTKAAQRKEAARASFVKTIMDAIDRTLSNEHDLVDQIKRISYDPCTKPNERKMIAAALDRLKGRADMRREAIKD